MRQIEAVGNSAQPLSYFSIKQSYDLRGFDREDNDKSRPHVVQRIEFGIVVRMGFRECADYYKAEQRNAQLPGQVAQYSLDLFLM